jgi:membrane-associated phospholipid phosphatase
MSRRAELAAIAVGLVVVTLGGVVASGGTVPGWEEAIFRRVNDLPDALHPLLWPVQQLGAVVAAPVVAVVAVVLRKWRLALAAMIVIVAKLVAERIVKALVTRERPATSIGSDIAVRGDVKLAGASFVSGHAIVVSALAVVIVPYLPPAWKPVPWVLVAAVAVARVYVGAHNPLDVVCGIALGIAVGAAIDLAVRPRRLRGG